MKAEIVNAFLIAAWDILDMEAGIKGKRGQISLASSRFTTQELTVIISIIGDVKGTFLIGLPINTAIKIVEIMLGEKISEFEQMVISGIGELGNIIAGRALANLEKLGYIADISPPMILYGKKASVSTLQRQRILIPLNTDLGIIELSVAMEK